MKKKGALLIIAALLITMTACGGSGGSQKKGADKVYPGTPDKDMVTLNVTAEPQDLNPMLITDSVAQVVLAHCMSGLTRLDQNDAAVADIAESWEINEDNTVYTMHLREDAVWTNGDPVTADDFYFSWVTQMKPETGTVYASYIYDHIKNGEAFYNGTAKEADLGIKVIDDYTLQIEWSHPMTEALGLFYLTQPFYLPVNQKAYEEIGADNYAKEVDQMVTNGYYRLTEWTHDSDIVIEKSEDYFAADEISIPKVKFVMIGDSNTSLNSFNTGEIDMTNIYSEQIAQIKEKSEKAVQSYEDGGSWYINFNLQDGYLSNANLRKALGYSLDIQSLLDNVINDGSVLADGIVPNVIMGAGGESYSETRGSLFTYDKEKALEYLELALKELGKTKEELKLTFYGTDTSYNQNQAAYLQQQWKKNLGLDVELKVMTSKALSEAQYSGEYTCFVEGWGPLENDPVTFLGNYVTDSSTNTGKYSNAVYDKLIEDAKQEEDAEKRQDMLIQAERMLIDDMTVAPMYFTTTSYAISEKIEGLVRTPFQLFSLRYAKIAE